MKIKWQFVLYGIVLDFVINERIARKHLLEHRLNISKYPPAFSIDVHIDDLVGVGLEGHQHNFKTIIISETDTSWIDKVKNEVLLLQ
ncbi:MAG: hypothetical protein AAFX87_04675 [Bacteroidota bacterium]